MRLRGGVDRLVHDDAAALHIAPAQGSQIGRRQGGALGQQHGAAGVAQRLRQHHAFLRLLPWKSRVRFHSCVRPMTAQRDQAAARARMQAHRMDRHGIGLAIDGGQARRALPVEQLRQDQRRLVAQQGRAALEQVGRRRVDEGDHAVLVESDHGQRQKLQQFARDAEADFVAADLVLLLAQQRLHGGIGGRQRLVGIAQLRIQAHIVVVDALQAEGFGDMLAQLMVFPGLGEELEDGALVDGVRDGLQLGIARQHDAYGLRTQQLGLAQEVGAQHAGHALVRHDHVDRMAGQHVQPFLAAVGRQDMVAIAPQQALEGSEDIRLVIDQQQGARRRHGLLPGIRCQRRSTRHAMLVVHIHRTILSSPWRYRSLPGAGICRAR